MTEPVDLRAAPLDAIGEIRFRTGGRDFFADETALWGRLLTSWSGIPDAGWTLPGAAPSGAGGPDWSLLDHVAHLDAWQVVGIAYIESALGGARWPVDEDFAGGDFDAFNETQRASWAGRTPADVRAALVEHHARLLEVASRVPSDVLAGEDVFPWVFFVLHGHVIDHLGVIEPWVARLRVGETGAA
jgi:hypothetical protein